MAVYEHRYKRYEGQLTPEWSRFLVLPRYAYQDLFKYKTFIALFVLCFVMPLACTIVIYIHHNTVFLTNFGLTPADIPRFFAINEYFFYGYTIFQSILAFIFTVIIGPVLISRDLTNNALPLYLCRPFSRFEYIIGKMSVLLFLLSMITWVPGLLLFLFQSYLEGGTWMRENLWIATAIFLTSVIWVGSLSLISMAISAWIKWRWASSSALFALFMIPSALGYVIQGILVTTKGHLINFEMAWRVVSWDLFGINDDFDSLSVGEAWVVFAIYAVMSLFMLWRKVRAYEVVS